MNNSSTSPAPFTGPVSFILVSWNIREGAPVLRRFSSLEGALSTIHDEIDKIAKEQYMTHEEKEECITQDYWNSVFLEGFDGITYYWWVVNEASVEDCEYMSDEIVDWDEHLADDSVLDEHVPHGCCGGCV